MHVLPLKISKKYIYINYSRHLCLLHCFDHFAAKSCRCCCCFFCFVAVKHIYISSKLLREAMAELQMHRHVTSMKYLISCVCICSSFNWHNNNKNRRGKICNCKYTPIHISLSVITFHSGMFTNGQKHTVLHHSNKNIRLIITGRIHYFFWVLPIAAYWILQFRSRTNQNETKSVNQKHICATHKFRFVNQLDVSDYSTLLLCIIFVVVCAVFATTFQRPCQLFTYCCEFLAYFGTVNL